LLTKGLGQRYFLYALGEIALVVVGILIALQINNWNQNAIDRREEKRILTSVAAEVNTLSWQAKRGLDTYQNAIHSSRILIQWVNDPDSELTADSVYYHLGVLSTRWIFGKSNVTNLYDALAGSGELGLIESDSLRQALITMDRQILLLAGYEDFQTEFLDQQFRPFLQGQLDMIRVINQRNRYIDDTFGLNPENAEIGLHRSRFQAELENLRGRQEFSNLLAIHISKTSTLIPIYERLQRIIRELDKLIGEELRDFR
jgi:type II secretory pathway pseudopilin PulG